MAYKITKTGRWAAQGRDANGKRVQLGTYATKREASKAEDAYKRRRPGGDTTVTEWRDHWLTHNHWQDSTRQHNAERTKRFVEQHGKKKLAAIDRTIAREFIKSHPSSHPCLSSMFGAAMYEDDEHGDPLRAYNPFSRLVKTTTRRRDLQSEWLTAPDVESIEAAARELGYHWAACMVRFAAETGVRPGELFVIQHDDLFNADGVARITKAADSKTKIVKKPKNGRDREIVLSTRAFQAAASAPATGVRVFSNPRGDQFWNSTWTYYWHQIRAAAGRPTMDFYELRHYCATRLLEAGLTERDVAEQLGHTDGGELVRKVYGHPSKRQALDRVRRALDNENTKEAA